MGLFSISVYEIKCDDPACERPPFIGYYKWDRDALDDLRREGWYYVNHSLYCPDCRKRQEIKEEAREAKKEALKEARSRAGKAKKPREAP